MFQGSFKRVSWKFQGNLKDVSRKFRGFQIRLKGVSSNCKGVSRVFEGSLKMELEKFQWCFNAVVTTPTQPQLNSKVGCDF